MRYCETVYKVSLLKPNYPALFIIGECRKFELKMLDALNNKIVRIQTKCLPLYPCNTYYIILILVIHFGNNYVSISKVHINVNN